MDDKERAKDFLPEENEEVEFTDLPAEEEINDLDPTKFSDAVLHSTDWTTETIISQLQRGNIILNPSFQRRDAWNIQQKSRFIESLILGLPVPQIVLAEKKDQRGKFIVLDGKQRLLSLLQFWGLGEGEKNNYPLSGLNVKQNLQRKHFTDLEKNMEFEDDLNSLLNQPIRTVVIRNWSSIAFLHLVFLRLNTGSVKLSPQELRQALFPGPFSNWVDSAASNSPGIKALLNLKEPDYRMRDIEILARYLAFRFFLENYSGRMREFLDNAFKSFNDEWDKYEPLLTNALKDLEETFSILHKVFGPKLARKPETRQFNRAIFDVLSFYAQQEKVRHFMTKNISDLKASYEKMFDDSNFRAAIERDTAGVPNTVKRLAMWGEQLNTLSGFNLPIPSLLNQKDGMQKIAFSGF